MIYVTKHDTKEGWLVAGDTRDPEGRRIAVSFDDALALSARFKDSLREADLTPAQAKYRLTVFGT